ncbi:MAG: aldehyde dehydrogenase family protein [Acidimicrobiia bacterium]
MSFPDLYTWIAGSPEPSEIELEDDLFDPNTSSPIQRLRSSSEMQVDRAIEAAARAHASGVWRRSGVADRAAVLDAFANELEGVVDDVARLDSLNSGVPITVTRILAASLPGTVRAAAELAKAVGDVQALPADGRTVRLRKEPWGPAALILPWNAPSAMATKKLAFCLAAGATAVVKPSPASPWSAQLIVEAAAQAGLPSGVVNLVLGGRAIGERLVGDPRIHAISMTGSTPNGKAIAARAGANLTRLQLELGSNNPAIVRADADIEATAASVASGTMKLSGQWCEAPRRVLADRSILPNFVETLIDILGGMRLGSSLDDDTEIGPVAFEARRDELVSQRDALVAAGAKAVGTSPIPDAGWFVSPTVIVGDAIDLSGELFGPMVTVQPTDDDRQAVRLANQGSCGLAGYVYSRDLDAALTIGARLVAGEVKVNGSSVLDLAPGAVQSFFSDSGVGGHGDANLLEFFRGTQVVGVEAPGLPI